MVEGFLSGVTIGFIVLIGIVELGLTKVCRLCWVFWLSVVYCIITNNWWAIGLVNLVAHLSFLTFKKVAYVEEFTVPSSGSSKAGKRIQGGPNRPEAASPSPQNSEL
jgi:hypothetical protein